MLKYSVFLEELQGALSDSDPSSEPLQAALDGLPLKEHGVAVGSPAHADHSSQVKATIHKNLVEKFQAVSSICPFGEISPLEFPDRLRAFQLYSRALAEKLAKQKKETRRVQSELAERSAEVLTLWVQVQEECRGVSFEKSKLQCEELLRFAHRLPLELFELFLTLKIDSLKDGGAQALQTLRTMIQDREHAIETELTATTEQLKQYRRIGMEFPRIAEEYARVSRQLKERKAYVRAMKQGQMQ